MSTLTIIGIVVWVLFIITAIGIVVYLVKKPAAYTCNEYVCVNGTCSNNVCICNEGYTGGSCNTPVSKTNSFYKGDCNLYPIKCDTTADCDICTHKAECKMFDKNTNSQGLSGKFCVAPLDTFCEKDYGGDLVWTGWTDVQKAGWSCEPRYPDIFPSATKEVNADICSNYTYTPGTDPTKTFRCVCDKACKTNNDCPANSVCGKTGKCKLRSGYNSKRTGPVCVADTCKTVWVPDEDSDFGVNGQCATGYYYRVQPWNNSLTTDPCITLANCGRTFTREVECVDSDQNVVDDTKCTEQKPPQTKTCAACKGTYVIEWSECQNNKRVGTYVCEPSGATCTGPPPQQKEETC